MKQSRMTRVTQRLCSQGEMNDQNKIGVHLGNCVCQRLRSDIHVKVRDARRPTSNRRQTNPWEYVGIIPLEKPYAEAKWSKLETYTSN